MNYWFNFLIYSFNFTSIVLIIGFEIATLNTKLVCPFKVFNNKPVSASHILMLLSKLPDTIFKPSGEYATLYTQPVCPFNVFNNRPNAGNLKMYIQASIYENG